MKPESRQFICPVGTTLVCVNGNTWVYIGYRITRVQSYEHHFARSDIIYDYGPWTYKAVTMKTLYAKFPDFSFSIHKRPFK